MYADNSFGRRRSDGWAERRRYFRKLAERSRSAEAAKSDDKPKRG